MGVGGAGRHWGHWELLGWELGALSEAGAHRDSNHPPKAQQVPPMAEGPPEPLGAGEHWSLCPHLLCHPVSPGCHPLCPGCHPGVTPCHLVVTTRSAGPRPPLTLCAPSRCPQHQVRLSLVHTAPQLPPSAPSKPSTCHPPPPPSAGCWRRRRGGAKLWGRSLRQKGGGAMAWRWSLRQKGGGATAWRRSLRQNGGGAKLWGQNLRQKGGGATAWRWSLRLKRGGAYGWGRSLMLKGGGVKPRGRGLMERSLWRR